MRHEELEERGESDRVALPYAAIDFPKQATATPSPGYR